MHKHFIISVSDESSTYLTTTPGPSSVALSSSCAQNSQTMYKLELQSSEYRPGLAKYKQAEERRGKCVCATVLGLVLNYGMF